MSLASLSGKENACGLADVLGSCLSPLDVLGVALREHADFLAVDHQVFAVLLHGAVPAAVNGVVFEVVHHVVDVHEGLVHCDDVRAAAFDGSAADQTPDSSESVDAEVEFLSFHGDFFEVLGFFLWGAWIYKRGFIGRDCVM